MHITGTMSTQVESRLPTLQPRRSLLPGPKSYAKPPHLSPTTPSTPFKNLVLGERVETTDGRTGILHFKGKTHFTQGCMCGIELDDPIGKHDGSVDGIHYFDCRQGYGVFISAHKVQHLPPPSPTSPTSTLSQNSSTSICSRESRDSIKGANSRIPTLGQPAGKLPRPKTLPVSKDSQSISKLKPNRKSGKNCEARSDTSSEKSSTSSKLFQSKKISPVHTNITHSGWTGDNRTKANSKRTTEPHSNKHKTVNNTTFNASDNKRQYARVSGAQEKHSRTSGHEESSKSLLQRKLARNKNVNGKLHSRPSLNDLTRSCEEENQFDRPDLVEECYSKFNETFELDKEVSSFFQNSCSGSLGWDDQHSLSPLEDSSSGREKSDSSLAWDFEVPQASTPVQIHLQVSSDVQPSIPEEPRIYPLGIGATAPAFPVDSLSSCDTENTDEEVEYNEFLAIPSYLDTPTGRYKFDLLTPEELEQALNEYNLLPEELQDAIEFEPQFSDVKPRIWEPITTVEDEFFRESRSELFSVPLTTMDAELKEKYEGIETPRVNSEATTPIGIASNGMEVDCYLEKVRAKDVHGKPLEYPSILPTPTSTPDYHNLSMESGTIVGNSDEYDDHVNSHGTLCDAHDTTLVDNPSSMDDGVDLSEDFEMEVDPHNTTYDVDDCGDQEELGPESSTFVIPKCNERRQEADGREKLGLMYESNNNTPVPMSPVDLLEGTFHVKSCDSQNTVVLAEEHDSYVAAATPTSTTSGRIVASVAMHVHKESYADPTGVAKLDQVKMDIDANESMESECSRTESDQATERTAPKSGIHNAQLQAVMDVGMCLSSQSNQQATNSNPKTDAKVKSHHSREEKKDEEKPKKRSLLLTPKKVSKTLATNASHLHVTLSRAKSSGPATASSTATSKPLHSSTHHADREKETTKKASSTHHVDKDNSKKASSSQNVDKDNSKKTYTPSSWRGEKGEKKSGVIPRRRSVDSRNSGKSADKNNPARHSADAAHLIQKLQPILDAKNERKTESASSMEVDHGSSMASSNKSMRSEVTVGSNNSKIHSRNSQSNEIKGKPTHKTTLSLRNSTDGRRQERKERKPSSSSVTSDHSHRTDSRTSISSRPSPNSSREVKNARRNRSTFGTTQSSRYVTNTKPPVPTASTTSSRNRQNASSTSGRPSRTGSSKTSQQDANATNVDAAPTRRSTVPSTRKSAEHKRGANSQKDPHGDIKNGPRSKVTALHAAPPDLVYTSLVNGEATMEIKRLQTLCDTRFQEFTEAKGQLCQATKGFDAMSALNKYLTEELDAFSTPELKAQNDKLTKQVENSAAKIAEQEVEIATLQSQIQEESRCHAEEMRRTELHHMDEMRHLDDTLRTKHSREKQTLMNDHSLEVRSLADNHQKEICDMTASHQSLVQDIEKQQADHLAHLNHTHMSHMEELMRERDQEVQAIRGDAEEKMQALQDEIFKWKHQADCQLKRTQELEEVIRKDDDEKVQAAIAQFKHLPDEVASMKAVMEIKNQEIHELRKAKMGLEKQVELIPDKDERIKNLMAKVEDVKALMARKTEYERQLSSEHVHLRESYERESNANKRLSMEKEELVWRLNEGKADSLSPPPRFNPTSAPSPSPSPTATRKGFMRSSSTESHESGVYSPNPST